MDAIWVTGELAIIKTKYLKYLVLKLDLIKACDRVNWDYLRLVLLQVGLSLEATNWIMACVDTTMFVVLASGEPTNFFRCSRGLR